MKLKFILPKDTVQKLYELKKSLQMERNSEVDQMLKKGILVPRRRKGYDERGSNSHPRRVSTV